MRAVEQVLVQAPRETVWELLLDKAENPQRYLEGILDYRLLGRGGDWLRRELQLEDGLWLRERVDIDAAAGLLTFRLEEHPWFQGAVRNRLEDTPGGVRLTFEMDWTPRPDTPSGLACPVDLIHGALERTRAIAEELARAAGTIREDTP